MKPSPAAILLAGTTAAVLLQIAVVHRLASHPVPTLDTASAAAHLLACTLAAAATLPSLPNPVRAHPGTLAALLLGLLLPAPILGPLAVASLTQLLASTRPPQPTAPIVVGETPHLTRPGTPTASQPQPTPVLRILGSRQGILRRQAILSLRRSDAKKALPLLQKAIQDSDEQVRLLAQAQYSRILTDLETQIKRMEASLGDQPDPAHLVRLAEHYHELVYLGLASEETVSLYLDRALELSRRALNLEPANLNTRFLLLKLAVKRGHQTEAARALAELQSSGLPPETLLPWEADLHFQARDWPAVARSLATLHQSGQYDRKLQPILDFWTVPQPAARS